jgi:hypothetical protein
MVEREDFMEPLISVAIGLIGDRNLNEAALLCPHGNGGVPSNPSADTFQTPN